jgi:hypothetical protein
VSARIDGITLTLDVADEFEGRRTITFAVPLPDDAFEAAVREKWHEYTLRLWLAAKAEPGAGLVI